MSQRPESARELLVDAGLAAAAFALSASILIANPLWAPGPRAEAWILVTAHTVPVALRRRAPAAAFAVSLTAGAAYLALDWPMVGLGLASLVMTYSLAAAVPRPQSLAGLAAVELALLGYAALGDGDVQPDTVVGNLVIVAAAWILGDGARRRRDAGVAEQRRAARQAVADERLRIARELHDVVAHSMSVIAVQAGTGRMVIDDDVDHARRALASIEETSKRALDEMRRLLGVLRADEADGGAALAPVPTLDDLDRLVAYAVEGGTPVDVAVSGDRGAVPAGIQLAAYRLVQEALTNVRRHAPGCEARVRLCYEPEALVVEVENRLAATQAAAGAGGGTGHGLIGMRERVSLYGGDFSAGPGRNGTFLVSARLPYEVAAR